MLTAKKLSVRGRRQDELLEVQRLMGKCVEDEKRGRELHWVGKDGKTARPFERRRQRQRKGRREEGKLGEG